MREFIEKMRKAGRVIDVHEPRTPDDMKAAQQASATDKLLFFHNIGGARAVMNVTANRHALSLALGIDEKNLVKKLADANFDGKIINDGKLAMKKPALSKIPVCISSQKTPGNTSPPALSFRNGMGWRTRPSTACSSLTTPEWRPGSLRAGTRT